MSKPISTVILLTACLAACDDKVQPWSQASVPYSPPAVKGVMPWIIPPGILSSGHCNLDTINGDHPVGGSVSVSSQKPVRLQGWVATAELKNPGKFTVVLDGPRSFGISTSASLPRDDVAKAHDSSALTNTGFMVDIDPTAVPPGNYRIMTAFQDPAGQSICNTMIMLEFL